MRTTQTKLRLRPFLLVCYIQLINHPIVDPSRIGIGNFRSRDSYRWFYAWVFLLYTDQHLRIWFWWFPGQSKHHISYFHSVGQTHHYHRCLCYYQQNDVTRQGQVKHTMMWERRVCSWRRYNTLYSRIDASYWIRQRLIFNNILTRACTPTILLWSD